MKIVVTFRDGGSTKVEGDYWQLDLHRDFIEIWAKGCDKDDCQNERIAAFNIGEVKSIQKGD